MFAALGVNENLNVSDYSEIPTHLFYRFKNLKPMLKGTEHLE